MKQMVLYGAGGHAKVIKDIAEATNTIIKGIIDDNPERNEFMNLKVFHTWNGEGEIIVSIGDNNIRKIIVDKLNKFPNTNFGIAIHPSAILSPHCIIGEGSVIMQGSIIQSCTKIGKHCIINSGASIDHDCTIKDFVHISPHATICGDVTIGEGTWIGAGAVVIPGINIGKNCVIGAGSVVCKNIPDEVVAYGNPCKIIKEHK